jgi:hypothetical protein
MDADGGREKRQREWAMQTALSQSLLAVWRFPIKHLHTYLSWTKKFMLKQRSCHRNPLN